MPKIYDISYKKYALIYPLIVAICYNATTANRMLDNDTVLGATVVGSVIAIAVFHILYHALVIPIARIELDEEVLMTRNSKREEQKLLLEDLLGPYTSNIGPLKRYTYKSLSGKGPEIIVTSFTNDFNDLVEQIEELQKIAKEKSDNLTSESKDTTLDKDQEKLAEDAEVEAEMED